MSMNSPRVSLSSSSSHNWTPRSCPVWTAGDAQHSTGDRGKGSSHCENSSGCEVRPTSCIMSLKPQWKRTLLMFGGIRRPPRPSWHHSGEYAASGFGKPLTLDLPSPFSSTVTRCPTRDRARAAAKPATPEHIWDCISRDLEEASVERTSSHNDEVDLQFSFV